MSEKEYKLRRKEGADMIDRAQLRGKPLDEDCKTAHTTTNEYGVADNRVFCYGLFDPKYDVPIEKCYGCKAFVENATPMKGGEQMNIHDATETAYKNGYAQGKADAAKKIEDLECDLEVWKQERFNIFQATECYERARRQAAGEIFDELDGRLDKICIVANKETEYSSFICVVQQVFDAVGVVLAELKKKYTEDAPDTNVGGKTEGIHEK